MKKYMVILWMFLFLAGASNLCIGQTATLGNVTGSAGETVLVPIEFNNFNNIGAMTLFIEFDSDVATFNQITNVVPEGSGTFSNFIPGSPAAVGLSWTAPGFSGVDFPNGKYLDLEFTLINGYSDLVFGDNCEVADWEVNILDVTFIDGSIGGSSRTLNLKLFLEGSYQLNSEGTMSTLLNTLGLIPNNQPFAPSLPYYGNVEPGWYYSGAENAASFPEGTVDWILIELRDATSAMNATETTIKAQRACFVKSDGTVVDLDGNAPSFFVTIEENLFITVYHRNHLGILSSGEAQETSPGVFSYDFSTGDDKVLGGLNGYSELQSGVWGMSAGDINGDQSINELDKIAGWETEAGKSGYYGTDTDMDGQINNPDKNEFLIHNYGKFSTIPE